MVVLYVSCSVVSCEDTGGSRDTHGTRTVGRVNVHTGYALPVGISYRAPRLPRRLCSRSRPRKFADTLVALCSSGISCLR